MNSGISNVNESKFSAPRPEDAEISPVVITSGYDTTMEIVGLGELAPDRHIAPGSQCP
ncbi:MAG: hypothetical protein ACHP6I_03440 [Rickettsiales bacterium]